jgi:small subunit ribosomal protein S2
MLNKFVYLDWWFAKKQEAFLMAEETQPSVQQANEAISMKQLLEAGVHFGHQISHWNPKMKDYIFGNRNGIHIIDLQQTVGLFKKAYNFVRNITAEGGEVLFVGTKKQAQGIISEETVKSGMPYVNSRWLGGTLTNFSTIRARVDYLLELKKLDEEGHMDHLPKKEVKNLKREMQKLEHLLGGIVNMKSIPQALYIVDTRKEHIAVKEARKLGIPIVAVVDTNSNPADADVIIPSNDDAIRAIKLFTSRISDACIEGKHIYEQKLQAGEVVEKEQESKIVVERKVFVFKEYGEQGGKEGSTSVAVSEATPGETGAKPEEQPVKVKTESPPAEISGTPPQPAVSAEATEDANVATESPATEPEVEIKKED